MPPKRDLLAMLALAAIGAACIWLATGCESVDDLVRNGPATVYVCDHGCSAPLAEFCWDGPRADLEKLLGASCHEETTDERWWPALAGCIYGCEPHSGCDAMCGCAGCP